MDIRAVAAVNAAINRAKVCKKPVAVRPVKGVPVERIDEIQKSMVGYNNLISPPYFPVTVPTEVDGKWIIVIVARTGQQRLYKSPEHVTGKNDKKYNYYIRYLTSSIKANPEQEHELINMADQTPFDCRANHKAQFDDISPVLLEDHFRKTGSKLAKQVRERGVEEILGDIILPLYICSDDCFPGRKHKESKSERRLSGHKGIGASDDSGYYGAIQKFDYTGKGNKGS